MHVFAEQRLGVVQMYLMLEFLLWVEASTQIEYDLPVLQSLPVTPSTRLKSPPILSQYSHRGALSA